MKALADTLFFNHMFVCAFSLFFQGFSHSIRRLFEKETKYSNYVTDFLQSPHRYGSLSNPTLVGIIFRLYYKYISTLTYLLFYETLILVGFETLQY